jgi:branched-chain amino acid transport system ATP-binding protein
MVDLEVNSLTKSFGGLNALDEVSFSVAENEFHAFIGPNGAGKTTLFNVLSGGHSPDSGNIRLAGEDITSLSRYERVKKGMLRTFQIPNVFSDLSIERNVRVALNSEHNGLDKFKSSSRLPDKEGRIEDLLSEVGLADKIGLNAGELSYGQQKRLEIAIILGMEGDILLLDEPTAGLDPDGTTEFVELLSELQHRHGLTILLIEHDMDIVMGRSDKITVLNKGRVIFQGSPDEVRDNDEVTSVYFGDEFAGTDGHESANGDVQTEEVRSDSQYPSQGANMGSNPCNDRILEVDNIHTYYGDSHILQGVSLAVNEGEIVAIIGPNGSGKSTTMRSVIGIKTPSEGAVRYQGTNTVGNHPFENARQGLILVSQDRGIFPNLTVLENLKMGTYGKDAANIDRAFKLFPHLEEKQHVKGNVLSGGEEAMLAMARGVISDPELMLLDEPLSGLAPAAQDTLLDIVDNLNDEGISILMVEQWAKEALEISDRAYILETGQIEHSGPSQELLHDVNIRDEYLSIS